MIKLLQFKRHLLVLLLCAGSFLTASAQMIKGTVADKETDEPLVGATVTAKNKDGFKRSISVGLDGSFIFRNVPAGKYEVEAKYVSYKEAETHIDLTDGGIQIVKLQLVSKASELNEVKVKGSADRTSDQSARKLEQRSSQVLNAVSAHAIEISPDITVANVTQRVSGVTIQRSNNGEGQYAIIRGMEKRYTYTLVNGFKIPSPDNKNRYIPLDIFPADIVDRLEVYKSLTPSMEGDAVAGGINLALKQAPDDFTVSANFGVGLSQSVMNTGFTNFGANNVTLRSPRAINGDNYSATLKDFTNDGQHFSNSKLPIGTIANVSVGGRSADKKFGALVSLSYQNIYKNTDGVFFGSDVDEQSRPSLTNIQRRKYNIEQERSSVIGRFDYKFDGRNKLGFDVAYINLTQNQYRFVSDTSLTLARTGIGFGRVTQDPRAQRDVQHIYDFTLHGENRLTDNFSINYTGKFSKATANENRYDLNLITNRTLVNGAIVQAPVTIDALAGKSQIFSYNSDQDKSAYLNLVYTPKIGDTKVEFTAGGMYRNKTRNSMYDKYTFPLDPNQSVQTYDGNIDHNTFVLTSFAQGTNADPLNYDFTENIGAGYGQFKFTVDKLEVLGGARYEHTSQNYFDAVPPSQEGKTGSIKYFDVLPSLNLKYMLSDKENLRASYYSAISRPNFYELVPHSTGDPDADYQERGNPHLKRATSDNFDIRYEFFPKPLDQLLVGVFYKSIVDPIEYALVNLKAAGSAGYALEAENFGTAHNYGFEADFTKYIRNFGFRANYSYTNSSITTTKAQKYVDGTSTKDRVVEQTRPLQGQSKNVGNLSLLYKDTKMGLDAQVSAVYTGERINSVSDYLNNDIWQKGFVTLDVSAEKRIVKGLYVYAKATNLTNTPYELFIKQPYPPLDVPGRSGQALEYQQAGKNVFIRKDTYNQYYILGIHYKF